MTNQTITAPKGFRAAAVKAGLKHSGALDLGLIVADRPCTAAAVFTTNKIVSAPVVVSREHIRSGKLQAVFVNAGNSNACTGQRGFRDTLAICRQVGRALNIDPHRILVASTGIIGEFLPMEKVHRGIEAALAALRYSPQAGSNLARAILTTDTKKKTACRQIRLGGKTVQLAGIAKGSGMIAPNMATMLAFITTDANISPALLRRSLSQSAAVTFNKVTVDMHTSTSDTAVVLASGLAGNARITRQGTDYQKFHQALWQICDDLARQIAADGEGATCAVTVRVTEAANPREARQAVRAIVDSPLVRCAFFGADPNWGRIVSAIGYSGARFHPEKLSCKVAGVTVFRNGRPAAFNRSQLSRKMKARQWQVHVCLGAGKYEDFCYTCDLSHGYVSINADYHT